MPDALTGLRAATVDIPDTLAFLIGSWTIHRVIDDRRDGRSGTFSGTAVLAPVAGGARYLEEGQITFGTHTGPARRGLSLTAHADGSVRLDFRDGRPFIDVDLRAGRAGATHPCGADHYEMSFEVLDPRRIRERWRVTGPAKDYEAETIWQRR